MRDVVGLGEKGEGIKQKTQKLIDSDNSVVITREKERWGEVKEGTGKINGDGRGLDLGWWTHNTIYRWCIIELYTWNLYNFINQCHPNRLYKK